MRNVLAALDGRQVRIALMSTIGATDRKGSHDWKRRGERLVRASGLPYTIVRPAWFDYNKPDENRLLMLQGDKALSGSPADGVIARRQLAEVLVRSLKSPDALHKTFELHAEKGLEQDDFDPAFAALEPDSAGALDGVRDRSNMPIDEEPQQILVDLEKVRASFDVPSLLAQHEGTGPLAAVLGDGDLAPRDKGMPNREERVATSRFG